MGFSGKLWIVTGRNSTKEQIGLFAHTGRTTLKFRCTIFSRFPFHPSEDHNWHRLCCQLQEVSNSLSKSQSLVRKHLNVGQVSEKTLARPLLIILHHPDPAQHSRRHSAVFPQTSECNLQAAT